jgi:hypothetical protein
MVGYICLWIALDVAIIIDCFVHFFVAHTSSQDRDALRKNARSAQQNVCATHTRVTL